MSKTIGKKIHVTFSGITVLKQGLVKINTWACAFFCLLAKTFTIVLVSMGNSDIGQQDKFVSHKFANNLSISGNTTLELLFSAV